MSRSCGNNFRKQLKRGFFMKKFLLTLITLPFLLFSESPEILFLSTQHTGTHLSLYCLCNLLGKRVIFNRGPAQDTFFEEELIKFNNFKKEFIYASHNPKDLWIKKDGEKKDILIVVLRNYRECLLRNHKTFQGAINEIKTEASYNWANKFKALSLTSNHNHYFNNLRCYDFWDPDKRFLIHYEDLILNPEKVLIELAHFLNVNEEILNNFLENFDYHKKFCLEYYDTRFSKSGDISKSKGKDVLYHSKKLGFDKCVTIDSLAKELFPDLFDKYLKRYEIKNSKNLH
jgi:hypothetical protein